MLKSKDTAIEWCKNMHRQTNHFYDNYIPYEFHLNMTWAMGKRWIQLIPEEDHDLVEIACYAHDIIEDTRQTYNDVKDALGRRVANISYALAHEKGKNRIQRADDRYYNGIVNTEYAVFVKLCDRMANVTYSSLFGGRMYSVYMDEMNSFVRHLGYKNKPDDKLEPMFGELLDMVFGTNSILHV